MIERKPGPLNRILCFVGLCPMEW
ncbi:hypothetical protein LCGC14_2375800, partial [marine sediment metagenome]